MEVPGWRRSAALAYSSMARWSWAATVLITSGCSDLRSWAHNITMRCSEGTSGQVKRFTNEPLYRKRCRGVVSFEFRVSCFVFRVSSSSVTLLAKCYIVLAT